MNRLRILVLPFAILGILLTAALAAPVAATTEHCPPGDKTEANGGNQAELNAYVPPSGLLVCIKGSIDATGVLVADGVTSLYDYLGNGHDVSYWVEYPPKETPEVTPSLTPTPEPTPTPVPSSTPTPATSPTPAATSTPTPTTSPSTTPTPSTASPTPSSSDSPTPTSPPSVIPTGEPTPETSLVPPTETIAPRSTLPPTDTVLIEQHPSGNVLFIVVGLLLTSAGALGLVRRERQR